MTKKIWLPKTIREDPKVKEILSEVKNCESFKVSEEQIFEIVDLLNTHQKSIDEIRRRILRLIGEA